MKAIIAEKPSVAREIAQFLGAHEKKDGYLSGNGYGITWALGHLIALGMPEDYGVRGFNKGQKSTKFVVTAAGSNSFCGFYQKGTERKFYIPTLRESVESLKQGFEPCPITHPEDSDFKLIFVLNPSDLVYVPTDQEKENSKLIDFNNLKKEQFSRIYKFTDGSGTTMNFVPANTASLLFNMSNKEQEKSEIKLSIQNELGLGSPQSKNQNTLDGIQVKSFCWKLKVDKLGNISKA